MLIVSMAFILLLEVGKLFAGIDVEERAGLVVEGDARHLQPAVPAVDLALAGAEEVLQRRQHVAPHEAEDGMLLVAGARDRELRLVGLEPAAQAPDDAAGPEWRI